MSFDLSYTEEQRSMARTVTSLCREHGVGEVQAPSLDAASFPWVLWKRLAELGVFGIATPDGGGGAIEIAAMMESFGRASFPGPLVATFTAVALLEGGQRDRVVRGEAVVSVGVPPLMPWAPVAETFIELEGALGFLVRPMTAIETVETLGGEPWGRCRFERVSSLGSTGHANLIGDVARAAYLAAAGQRLVEAASEHARARTQFGRRIAEFQAVTHPLADSAMHLSAAAHLVRRAADCVDRADPSAPSHAAAARLLAGRAALGAAHRATQIFGALGVMDDGPVFHVARRIRQLVSLPPNERDAKNAVLARIGL